MCYYSIINKEKSYRYFNIIDDNKSPKISFYFAENEYYLILNIEIEKFLYKYLCQDTLNSTLFDFTYISELQNNFSITGRLPTSAEIQYTIFYGVSNVLSYFNLKYPYIVKFYSKHDIF